MNKKVQTIKFSSDYKDDKEIQCGYYEQYDEDVMYFIINVDGIEEYKRPR